MEPHSLFRQLEQMRRRIVHIESPAGEPVPAQERLTLAMQELQTAMEELTVADEELRQQNEELLAVRETLEAQKQRYQDLFEFAPEGYLVTDTAGTIWEANRAAARLLGVEPRYLVRKPLAVFVADEQRTAFRELLDRLQGAEVVREWEVTLRRRDGSTVDVAVAAAAVQKRSDQLFGIRWQVRDITHRRRAEEQARRLNEELNQRVFARTEALEAARAEAEAAARRLALVTQAGEALAASLDYERTLPAVARLLVPDLADWCEVCVADADGTLRPQAEAVSDPRWAVRVRELRERYPDDPAAAVGLPAARGGRSEIVPAVDDARLQAAARDPSHLALLRGLGLRSALVVPLEARGRTLGVIRLATAGSGRGFGADDVAVAEAVARRVAFALDNARLFAEAREAARHKDEFIALLAHELRNPLAPIFNALALIRLKPDDRANLDWARDVAERKARYLARLIDDLLDVSRILRGKLELRREAVELAPAVGRAVETVRPLVESRRHTLNVALPEGPVWLEADPVRVEQVLANLLTNAARYTEEGGRISLTVDRSGAGANGRPPEVVLTVRDTGVGLTAEERERIFLPFEQGGGPSERPRLGLGLGLSLVRSLVEMHGGTVRAKSDGPGRGSAFVVRLPALAEAPVHASPAARAADERPARPRRVLIVEDQESSAESLARLLEVWGHRARVCHDGATALALAAADPPEILLLDVGLPGMDGYEVARRFREEPRLAGVALVALTGFGQDQDRERALAAGIGSYLVKPVEPETLAALLARL
jgi:PAS domain S-box-containing protein